MKYQIKNGFRQRVVRLWQMPKIQLGLGILMAVVMLFATSGGSALAWAFPFKFKKDGLTGDNKKFYEDLEQRLEQIPDKEFQEVMRPILQLEVREALKMFEGLDEAKISKLKEMLGEDDNGVRAILRKQGEAIAKFEAKVSTHETRLSIRAQVEGWMTKNKDVIGKYQRGESKELPALEIRAANSPMTPANTISDTVTLNAADVLRMGQPMFGLRRVQPTFWNTLPKGRTGLLTYPWVNYKVPADSGAANFIGPGVAKPGVSFTLEVEQSNPKKVAVSLKVATELLSDVDGMTSFIQGELAYQHDIKATTQMISGAGSSTAPAGVTTFAVGYTLAGISVPNPNEYDCIRAVVAQLRTNFIQEPITVFINPVDAANMDLAKATVSGTYILPTFSTPDGKVIAGATVIEDNNISAGFVLALAMDCLKTLMYQDFRIAFGYENDDFTKNLVTVIGESRFHSFHSENDAQAFVYDDFADIKSQIGQI